jgi:phasin family protein
MEMNMMKSFEDLQAMNKDGIEAFAASNAALTKGYQAVAQEVADFSKKSFEKSAAVFQSAVSAKSFEKAVELQQSFAKEAFDAGVAEFTKLGELYAAAAKGAFKPYEATFAAFGVKAPVAK